MHKHTPYVQAYRARQKQILLDLRTELDRVKDENAALRHNLDVRERESETAWFRLAQFAAALGTALGRNWKYEDLPSPPVALDVWELTKKDWTAQIKPIPGDSSDNPASAA
jgi:hypothetical protein